MAWLWLLLAGLMEIGWPIGMKYAYTDGRIRIMPMLGMLFCLALSGVCLFMASRRIPIGTAYAVWTGIGAVGAVLVGILLFNEPSHWPRLFCVFLIVAGVVGLKLFAPDEEPQPTPDLGILAEQTTPQIEPAAPTGEG